MKKARLDREIINVFKDEYVIKCDILSRRIVREWILRLMVNLIEMQCQHVERLGGRQCFMLIKISIFR